MKDEAPPATRAVRRPGDTLRASSVSRSFEGVKALQEVTLELSRHEIVGNSYAIRQVLERVENLPGVASAGYSTSVPLSWKGGTSGFYPEGLRNPIPGMAYDSNHRQVSEDYLQTMNIPLRQGRYFTAGDNEQI